MSASQAVALVNITSRVGRGGARLKLDGLTTLGRFTKHPVGKYLREMPTIKRSARAFRVVSNRSLQRSDDFASVESIEDFVLKKFSEGGVLLKNVQWGTVGGVG